MLGKARKRTVLPPADDADGCDAPGCGHVAVVRLHVCGVTQQLCQRHQIAAAHYWRDEPGTRPDAERIG